METFRTEEEQVEALRKWWDENGRSTVVAIALALTVGFGWQAWQERELQQSEAASARYDEMLEASRQTQDEAQRATLRHLAEGIKTDYPNSSYAIFAAMHLARLAIDETDMDAAERELRWVLTAKPAEEIRLVAELRLARVIAAGGDAQSALQIIDAAEAGAYAPAFAEAKGDILQASGETDSAIVAYQQALALAAASGGGASSSLQLKLAALTPVPARGRTESEE